MKNENEESVVSVIGRLAGRLILLALAVLVLFVAGMYAYRFGKDIFYQEPMEAEPGTDVEVHLPEDITYAEFAELMELKGLIRNPDAFQIQARLYKTPLESGTYTLNTSMTSRELLTKISETALELQEETSAAAEGNEGAADGSQ